MAKDTPPSIDDLRARIDALDRRLVEVLNARLDCARQIGALKAETGAPIFVAPREKAVLEALRRDNPGPFPSDALARIYREIFSASRRAERPLEVTYAGAPGSLAHAAAHGIFGGATHLTPNSAPRSTLAAVARGAADYAVLPALVAPEGVGSWSVVHLLASELHLVAEFYLPLDLGIALPPRRKAVREVLVPPAFADQAAERIPVHLPQARLVPAASSAEAAAGARARRGTAALVPAFSAEVHGLTPRHTVLGPGEGPRVRFLVAAREPASPTGADKTTLAFRLRNEAGNLMKALRPYSKRRINLDLLTASPSGATQREDLFLLDLAGHADQPRLKKAVDEMREHCSFLEVLGSYPVFDPGSRNG